MGTLPSVAGYFISLLITKVLAGLPSVMLRPGVLVRMLLIKNCFKDTMITQRELDDIYKQNQTIYYGWEYPTQLLVIVICFTYSCISPIILPVGAIYFLFALFVYKKQCLVVYHPTYEGGGLMFPFVCTRTLIGLICGQVSLLGYMLIRQGIYQLGLMFPLPIFTIYMINMFNEVYAVPSRVLSLERAKQVDSQRKEKGTTTIDSFDKNAYRQPSLAVPKSKPMPYRRETSSQKGPRYFFRSSSDGTLDATMSGTEIEDTDDFVMT